MATRAAIAELVKVYDDYASLAAEMGMRVVKGKVRRYALNGLGYRGEMKSFFSANYADRHPDRTLPSAALERMQGLLSDLGDKAAAHVDAMLNRNNGWVKALTAALKEMSPSKREELRDALLANGHGGFLRRLEADIAEFHKALATYGGGQTIARARLIEHIQNELKHLGIPMSRASIEERFRRNTKVRTVPPEMVQVVRGLGEGFRTGLAPLSELVGDQTPVEWFEVCREELHFRSKNAMHHALAEATGVHYETVHKALTNPRPEQRMQKALMNTLLGWREAVRRGERLNVKAEYLGEKRSSEVNGLLRRLSRQSRTRSEALHAGARALGVGPKMVRKVIEGQKIEREFSDRSVRNLKTLVKEHESAHRRQSFLTAPSTRKVAGMLAKQTELARERWRKNRENDSLRNAFFKQRLQLIVAIREGYTTEELHWDPDLSDPLE